MKCQNQEQRKRSAPAGQTKEVTGQVTNHSTQDFNSGDPNPGSETPPVEPVPRAGDKQPTYDTGSRVAIPKKEECFVRKEKIKWPRASDKATWEVLDSDLSNILEQGLKGDVERKLNKFGNMVYDFCSGRLGTLSSDCKSSEPRRISRRQKEISKLIIRRRHLRKLWRKAGPDEKVGLQVLWEEVRTRLKCLRRAERLRRKRKRKENQRKQFFRNPFKFAKSLLEEKKGGDLTIGVEDLEAHLKATYSDPEKDRPLDSPGEVLAAVKRARAAAAPGPNGVPYRVYKMCPKTLRVLWKLMQVAWRKKCVPVSWRRAGGVLIPKERVSSTIDQFRNISLLNVEGKLFFTILAKRLTGFLLSNSYIDTQVQKAGIPGFPGCIEHANTIWRQIQLARSRKEDLHVVWLDLANAYGSIPHKVISYALDFFWVPVEMKQIVENYFADFKLSISTRSFTTGWQKLEKGIAMGCSISPLLFTMGFEIFLIGAKQVVGGLRAPTGEKLPPVRAFMDDVTSILRTAPCTTRLLQRLEELTEWAGMKFKPSKSRSLSLRKGKISSRTFSVNGQTIPTLQEEPVKSLGRLYTSSLKDTTRGPEIIRQATSGLKCIDECDLPGRLKVWCAQFVLFPRLKWPLKMYNISMSTVDQIDRKANSYFRRWLGVPRCLSTVALFGDNMLSLPLSSIAEEYKVAKVQLVLELEESQDPAVKAVNTNISTGKKWSAKETISQAVSRLQHKDLVGAVQLGRTGLGWGERTHRWSNANSRERRQLSQQGAWTNWDGAIERRLKWSDVWNIQNARLSFLLRAVYDVLPSPRNLTRWFKSEESCQLCGLEQADLKHILSNCSVALQQGRYTWRHNKALRQIAVTLEEVRKETAGTDSPLQPIQFVRSGQQPSGATSSRSRVGGGPLCRGVWKMSVDLDRQLHFPSSICATTLRPDLVLWSEDLKSVLIVELTVPWEENIQVAFERKKTRYEELVQQCRLNGWKTQLYPVEIGVRGFAGSSLLRLCRDLQIRGKAQAQLVRRVSEEVEKSSFVIWLRRKDKNWKQTSQK
ncbi:hypothetical protein Bbelb_395800 [Branchiostoma belcheri]|nr:hypothetical protein Bbelb_395800 [Branchiostoma belcheri]